MLAKLDFDEIIFSSDTCVQYRSKTDTKNRIDAIPREYQQALADLKAWIDRAYEEPAQDKSQPNKRLLQASGLNLILRSIETASGRMIVCSPQPGKPPSLSELKTIAMHARLELGRYLETGNGGVILISSIPGHGNTQTAASVYTTYIETHGGTGAYISRRHDYDLAGPTDNARGLTVPFRLTHAQSYSDSLLIDILNISPRWAFVDAIQTPEDARLILELASSGVTVSAAVDAGSIISAIDLLVGKASVGYGNLMTAREIVAAVLRSVIQTRGNNSPEYFFLGEPSTHATNLKIAEKIRNGNTATISVNVLEHTHRIKTNQQPFSPIAGPKVA